MSASTNEVEYCNCCRLDQEEAEKPYRRLKPLLRSTHIRHLDVLLCEYCDGPAYTNGRRKDNDFFDPDLLQEEDDE